MAKTFEEVFTECQEEAIRAALEFVEFRKEVEKVFVFARYHEQGYLNKAAQDKGVKGVYANNYFYQINGRIVYPGQVNDVLPAGSRVADASPKREVELLGPINKSFWLFMVACKENGWKIPAEVRSTKDMRTLTLSTACLDQPRPYDPRLNGVRLWISEEKAKLGQTQPMPAAPEPEESYGASYVKMRDIKSHPLAEYDSKHYEHIVGNVYRNIYMDQYFFTFSAVIEGGDDESRYDFLEYLAECYSLEFDDLIGKEENIDGVIKYVTEVNTPSGGIQDLIRILNFSTIVGKEICQEALQGNLLLLKYYGMGKATYNDKPFEIPIYGHRSNDDGLYNFEVLYPELQVKEKFEKGYKIRGPQKDARLKYVVVKDRHFFVVMTMEGKELILKFSLDGFAGVVEKL